MFLWSSLFERNCTFLVISSTSSPSKTYVWISGANDSNVLGLENKAGALIIMGQAGNLMTLYSSTQPTNNTVATLLDSGNFIFQEVYSYGSTKRVLWQSFDNPGNTLVPGMKLGINHKTGQTWSLRSWLTRDLPIPGPFSLEWEGSQLVIRRREVVYWKSENPSLLTLKIKISHRSGPLQIWGDYRKVKNPWPEQMNVTARTLMEDVRCGTYPNLGMIDYKANCSANCSCVAYTTLLGNWTGCRFWTTIANFTPTDMENSDQVYILSPKPSQTAETVDMTFLNTIMR
ncbi:hypothetical protein CMV_023423 [Castanea mollissima]|uniref:Bulb-type lectin domain-containing protein n=1 Tax=Castanea mollissima TaxID=60419 RepID=A0A8J4VDI4_9ROSI|nr:hypothetical protein CMV_023423 [Castanea mollissima]